MLVNDTPAMEMLDVRWAAGLHLSYDESAWAASRSRHRSPLGIVRVWRRQVPVRQRLPWLSRRSELFTQNPACLRLRPARILPLARHLDVDLASVTTDTVLDFMRYCRQTPI